MRHGIFCDTCKPLVKVNEYTPKAKENWDEWWKDLAPLALLYSEYVQDKTITWDQYVTMFTYEMKNDPESLEALERLRH